MCIVNFAPFLRFARRGIDLEQGRAQHPYIILDINNRLKQKFRETVHLRLLSGADLLCKIVWVHGFLAWTDFKENFLAKILVCDVLIFNFLSLR